MTKPRKHKPFNPEDTFDPKMVKLDPASTWRHAIDCPCSYCDATRQAIENAGERYVDEKKAQDKS